MIAIIKKLDPSIELPAYQTTQSAAFDIAAGIDMQIAPQTIAKIPTRLVIEAPSGHFLLITARSSLALKKGLQMANSVGIIDRDYSGPEDEVHLIVRNFTDQPVSVSKGERLAQGLFVRIDQAQWQEVYEIDKQSRGGIGSTGGYFNQK
jgi:dUTP pyrophosphatase